MGRKRGADADRAGSLLGTNTTRRRCIVVDRGKLPMSISFVLAILALVIALVNAVSGKAPLWIAVALLALAMILPGLPLKT
jgi:hypothetical protein